MEEGLGEFLGLGIAMLIGGALIIGFWQLAEYLGYRFKQHSLENNPYHNELVNEHENLKSLSLKQRIRKVEERERADTATDAFLAAAGPDDSVQDVYGTREEPSYFELLAVIAEIKGDVNANDMFNKAYNYRYFEGFVSDHGKDWQTKNGKKQKPKFTKKQIEDDILKESNSWFK